MNKLKVLKKIIRTDQEKINCLEYLLENKLKNNFKCVNCEIWDTVDDDTQECKICEEKLCDQCGDFYGDEMIFICYKCHDKII